MFLLDEKVQKQKSSGEFWRKKIIGELSKMFKNRDKTTKNDLNWIKN